MSQRNVSKSALKRKLNTVLQRFSDIDLKDSELDRLIAEISSYHKELESRNTTSISAQGPLDVSNPQFAAFFENAPIGYVIINQQKVIVSANRKFGDLVKRKRKIDGTKITHFIHPGSQDTFIYFLQDLEKAPSDTISEEIVLKSAKKKLGVKIEGNVFNNNDETLFRLAFTDFSEQTRYKQEIEQKSHDLGERVKELNCLYGIAKLIATPGISLDNFMQSLIELIPPSWHYPEITCARIQFNGKTYVTKNFKQTRWKQQSSINVRNRQIGVLEVYYLKQKPELDEGPFLHEERQLIDVIAKNIGQYLEHKQIEKEMYEVTELRSAIIQSSPTAIFSLDLKGKVLTWNPAGEKIFGWKAGEVLGKPLPIVPAEKEKEFKTLIQKVINEGGFSGVELVRQKKNGQRINVNLSTAAIHDTEGNVIGIMGSMEDITARKQAEKAIRVSEENLHITLNSIGDAVIVTDIKGRVTRMNPVAEKLTGWKFDKARDESLDTVFKIVNARTGKQAENPVKKVLEKGKVVGLANHTKLISKSGSHYQISDSGAPIKDEQGHITGVVLVFRDVTEDYQLREALKASEEKYRTVFENTGTATCIIENDGTISLANEQFARLAGYPLTKIQNKMTWMEFVVDEDLKRMKRQHELRRKNKEKALNQYEFRFIDKHNNLKNIYLYIDMIPGTDKSVASLLDITDRKKAEQYLKESEAKFRSYIQNAPFGIFVMDQSYNYLEVNKAAETMTGYKRELLLKSNLFQLIPEEEHDKVKNHLKHLSLDDHATIDLKLIRNDHNRRFWSITCTFLPDQKILSFAVDTTEKRLSEQALLDSQAELEQIFQALPNALVYANTERQFIRVNQNFSRLFGYNPEEVLGKKTELIYASKADFEKQGRIRYNPDSKEPHEPYMIRYRRKDGSIFPSETIGTAVRNARGQVVGFIGLIRDITQDIQAEAERERMFAAIEQAGESIIITDKEGTIEYVNPAFERVTGYSRSEAMGHKPSLLKSGQHDGSFYEDMWQKITKGRLWQGRIVNKRKNGTLYTEEGTISPVYDQDNRITNYVAVRHDITERLALEEQYLQSQKVESIGRLAGGVAHDFNNMLSVILGYGEILLGKLHSGDPLRENVKQIMHAGQRSASLTRQLLAFSRKQTLQPEVLNFNDVLRNLEKMLRRLIGEDIQLDLALAPDLAPVMADPGQIEQVVMNLSVNARDAMPQGGKLSIETANVELDQNYVERHPNVKPGNYVLLAVSDTGCGIDKAIISQIFDPFFTTKEKGKGTGLGLSTVYGIIKQSGGDIWVYSEPEQGTTFKIYLPQTEKTQEAKKEDHPKKEHLGEGKHILVVEDEETVRPLLENMLKTLGYKVSLAANGGEALLLVEEKKIKPDLIISDVIMPEMSGSVLAERLRRTYPDLKVLFMSGYTDDAIVRHGVLDSDTPFIQKPFTIKSLAEKINEVLS
ncbi:MAG: PAS domain S-box protein [Caldithrix sp.]|nr:PAS domain S-box protein [Caldithrix sp.]